MYIVKVWIFDGEWDFIIVVNDFVDVLENVGFKKDYVYVVNVYMFKLVI